MARDKEEGSRVPACLLRCGTKRQKMDKEEAGYGNVYNLLGLHRKTDRDCIPPLRSSKYKAERKRKRKEDMSETARRKDKKCEERETTACTMRGTEEKRKSEREAFIVEKGFGLAFCHPLLTSVHPSSGEFPNVCHPLRLFLLHGQCLSDRSQRQSHGNRDGFTVAGNPCRIYRLHSSGYVFLYLPFRISRPSTPSVLQSRVTTLHRRPEGALYRAKMKNVVGSIPCSIDALRQSSMD